MYKTSGDHKWSSWDIILFFSWHVWWYQDISYMLLLPHFLGNGKRWVTQNLFTRMKGIILCVCHWRSINCFFQWKAGVLWALSQSFASMVFSVNHWSVVIVVHCLLRCHQCHHQAYVRSSNGKRSFWFVVKLQMELCGWLWTKFFLNHFRFSFSPEELGSSVPPQPSSLILSPPNTPTMKTHQTQLQQTQPRQAASSQSKSKHSKQKSHSGQQTTEKSSKPSKAPLDPDRPKRPMNAFMLFAKQHRLKLIRMHPGKDNRFVFFSQMCESFSSDRTFLKHHTVMLLWLILCFRLLYFRYVSVILGEAWRQLPADQKEVFITEAKALSHERKRLHPECWKRKRSQSTS